MINYLLIMEWFIVFFTKLINGLISESTNQLIN